MISGRVPRFSLLLDDVQAAAVQVEEGRVAGVWSVKEKHHHYCNWKSSNGKYKMGIRYSWSQEYGSYFSCELWNSVINRFIRLSIRLSVRYTWFPSSNERTDEKRWKIFLLEVKDMTPRKKLYIS